MSEVRKQHSLIIPACVNLARREEKHAGSVHTVHPRETEERDEYIYSNKKISQHRGCPVGYEMATGSAGIDVRTELFRKVSIIINISFRGTPHLVRDILYSSQKKGTLATDQFSISNSHPRGKA